MAPPAAMPSPTCPRPLTVKVSTDHCLEACKFRAPLDVLEPSGGAQTGKVIVQRSQGRRVSDEEFTIQSGCRSFEGTPVVAGVSAQNPSCYVVVSLGSDNSMTITPVLRTYDFREMVRGAKVPNLEAAEAIMRRRVQLNDRAEAKFTGASADPLEDEFAGVEKRMQTTAGSRRVAPADDSDDEFEEEDGNEGLDIADEDLFQDDNDDSNEAVMAREREFGVTEHDERAHEAACVMQERALADKERKRQLRLLREASEDEDDASDVGERLESSHPPSEWATATKRALKIARARARRTQRPDSEEEDSEEDDESLAPVPIARELATHASFGGGKRALSADGGSASAAAASGGTPKRAKLKEADVEQLRRNAAASGVEGVAVRELVPESDVVAFIHRRATQHGGWVTWSELKEHFEAFLARGDEAKAHLFAMIKKVATMHNVPMAAAGGTTKMTSAFELLDSTLAVYGLDDPHA